MKKTLLLLILVLTIGLPFYAIEARADCDSAGLSGPGFGSASWQSQKAVEWNDAQMMLENYIKSAGEPDWRLGEIKDAGTDFKGEILNKDNTVVREITVDKKTAEMHSEC